MEEREEDSGGEGVVEGREEEREEGREEESGECKETASAFC